MLNVFTSAILAVTAFRIDQPFMGAALTLLAISLTIREVRDTHRSHQ